MTSLIGKLALGGAFIASSVASAQLVSDERQDVPAQPAPVTVSPTEADNDADVASFQIVIPPREQVATPAHVRELDAKILDRVRRFNGSSGLAVKSIDDGWEAGWQTDKLFPQQSVSKIWVSMALLKLR